MLAPTMKPIYTPEYICMLLRLREARGAAGLTQAEVAQHFEQPQSFVSKCESGERRIDPIELAKFGKLYKQPLEFFLNGGENPNRHLECDSGALLDVELLGVVDSGEKHGEQV